MKKKLVSILFAIILIFTLKNYSSAANASIQCNSTATVNTPISITVTGSGVQWNLTLKVNGKTIASNSEFENVAGNKTISFTGNYTPTTTGNLTVSLEGSVTEANDGSTIKNFSTRTISVSANNNDGGTTSKSNNANLANLGITPNDFTGFRANKTSYSVTVPNNVSTINVYAKKGHAGQTISGNGNKTLNVGNNTFNVVVTAEDGVTKKTYTINVTRDGEGNTSTDTNQSNNADLQNLGIRPNDFSGFKANKTEYSVEVPNETEKIEIYASKGNKGQTISGTGTKSLKEGLNTFNVVVTAEDGKTQKTYTINVTRKEKTNEEENPEQEKPEETQMQEVFGLSELKIEGLELEPQFQTDIYEYKIELKENLEKLNITTVATEVNSNIEIVGNESLKEGENIITILVKGENEEKTATYQIMVNKTMPEIENTENIEQDHQKMINKIILISVATGVILIIIVALIITKIKKSREINDGYIPYENLSDNYEENEIEEKNGNSYNDEFFEEETKNKKRSKGKRFK